MFICNFEKGHTLHFLFLPVLVLDVKCCPEGGGNNAPQTVWFSGRRRRLLKIKIRISSLKVMHAVE